jgi:hypothetical protein
LISAFGRCGDTGNCVTARGLSSAASMAEAMAAPHRRDAAFAGALDAERIERAGWIPAEI